jgi:hypothetical protein
MRLLISVLILLRERVPSFDTLTLDGSDPARPFANSLTMTAEDFANFTHRDNDFSPMVYGIWWASTDGPAQAGDRWKLAPDADHHRIKGGQFILPEYRLGIDFARCVFMFTSSQVFHPTVVTFKGFRRCRNILAWFSRLPCYTS